MKRKAKAMGATFSEDLKHRYLLPEKASQPSPPTPCQLTFPLPLDILEEIFLHLPYRQVMVTCPLVCRQWRQVADSDSFWTERLRREGYHLRHASKTISNGKVFYFLSKMRRNLIQNPRGEAKMKGWEIVSNGGDLWKIEKPMVVHPDETVKKNFVTSYGLCEKAQLIDLVKKGYSQTLLDDFQPHIKISDWYAPRWDCGSQYTMVVKLLNQDKKAVAAFSPETVYFPQWNDQQWHQMTHVFKDYGRGVRYVHFAHGGKDTQFWAGWYGIRVTESCVEVCPEEDSQ